jgi:hypothetical protein
MITRSKADEIADACALVVEASEEIIVSDAKGFYISAAGKQSMSNVIMMMLPNDKDTE